MDAELHILLWALMVVCGLIFLGAMALALAVLLSPKISREQAVENLQQETEK